MDILIFKTTVGDEESVRKLKAGLDSLVGRGRWNFALDDCDKILRIVSSAIQPATAIQFLNDCGFDCSELPD